MKTTRLLILAGLFAGFSLIGNAGQTAQLFRPGDKPSAAPKTAAPGAFACPSCKDESVRVTRFVGPVNRQQVQSVEVARKHSCRACGSTVAAAHNCANEQMPGASCCAGRS
ncbi:hypothetical protein [Oleiharenicola sp. Vm1]|uniref:hypothetical protein n=1 Tax=Oleiharenicola sp. Vm1 TaxID=3398393 RepID=UPI0039F4F24C